MPKVDVYCQARQSFEAGDASYRLDADDLSNLEEVWNAYVLNYAYMSYQHDLLLPNGRLNLVRDISKESAEFRAMLYFLCDGDIPKMKDQPFWRTILTEITTKELKRVLVLGIALDDSV